jgi:uncharacterized Zn finger protein
MGPLAAVAVQNTDVTERSLAMSWYGSWRPYVPVWKRRANAAKYAEKLAKKEGRTLSPVKLDGRKIATSFWGQAWCDNLERYSDFANRLPRGRTYVRNGSVIDLQIERGKVKSIVSGSEIYRVTITISTLAHASWKRIKRDCSQSIDSLMDLLQGRFDKGIMQRLSQRDGGLFPQPKEIEMSCSCPDWAGMCKHVAATLYGVGSRLDTDPDLLFTLRDVDHLELISQAVAAENLDQTLAFAPDASLAGSDLGEMFGIDLAATVDTQKVPRRPTTPTTSQSRKKSGRKRDESSAAATKNATRERPTRRPVTSAATRHRRRSSRTKQKRKPRQSTGELNEATRITT